MSRRVCRFLGFTFLIGQARALTTSPVAAEEAVQHSVAIEWLAPAGCPSVDQIRTEVDSLLSRTDEPPDVPNVAAHADVTETQGRFVAQVRLESGATAEVKTIDADGCAALADAYAVIIAFAVDPSAGSFRATRPVAALQVPAEVTKPATDGPARGQQAASAAPRAVSRWWPAVGGGPQAAFGLGLLPSPSWGVGAKLALGTSTRGEIGLLYWPSRDASVSLAGQAAGGAVQLLSFQSTVCQSWRQNLAMCGGGDVGRLAATGHGVPSTFTAWSWWLAPTAGVVTRLPIARWLDVRIRLDVGAPIFRPSFVLEHLGPQGTQQVFRPAPVFGILSVEAELRAFSSTD